MIESFGLESVPLTRTVKIDVYNPTGYKADSSASILLCNDGQDLLTMNFHDLFISLLDKSEIRPVTVVGIHCSDDRMNEYGMASGPDYKGRGSKGSLYHQFVLEELLPHLHNQAGVDRFAEYSYAGFSLGGLSAIDIAWNHPELFSKVGVFSG